MARPHAVTRLLLALLALATALTTALPSAARAATTAGETTGRVYVARLRGGDGVDASAATALEDAVLVAAKKARPDLTVIGRADVAMLADLRAEQEAAGCDAESCAAEIADALGAPQIVTGKLSRLGSTWILSLTRLERGSLLVLARESVEKQGSSPEVLVGEVPKLVAAVFTDGAAADSDVANERGQQNARNDDGGVSGLVVGGGVGLGAGLVAAAGGAGLFVFSLQLYEEARLADARGDADEVARKTELGEPMYVAGIVGMAAGGAIALIGGVALAVGLAE